jgi:hypothetical protein
MTDFQIREMTDEDMAQLQREADAQRGIVDHRNIPPLLVEGLNRYAEHGVPVGDFLEAVIANDFLGAVGKADHNSMMALPAIASYVYLELPSICHGSRKVYRAWIAFHGAKRNGVEGDELQKFADAVSLAKNEANEWKQ